MTKSRAERAPAIDALRGLALFGVLIVNVVTAFRVSLFEQFVPAAPMTPLDHGVHELIAIVLEFKAYTLFAFLFGVGLASQYERAKTRGVSFARYVARRLSFLLALGIVHMFLIWNGDILTLYALTGIVAAPLLGLRVRVLLPIALALFVVQLLPVPWPNPFPSWPAMTDHIARARLVYGFGTFGEVLDFRIHEVRSVAALLLWIFPRTIALHLLGVCAWRSGVFHGERRRLVVLVAAVGLGLGVIGRWALDTGHATGRLQELAQGWGSIVLALGYGAAFLVVCDRPSFARAARILEPLGRMALTSYLTQSIVLGIVFYGYGFRLFGRLGVAQAAEIGVILYVVQIVLSAIWMRRYRFGPVEWLWRSFTWWARQPMRAGG